MNFKLPELPYSFDYLEPNISKNTVEFHYLKHHQGYVDKLNKMTRDTDWAMVSIEELIKATEGNIFNQASQVWNHAFYWHCLSRESIQINESELKDAIEDGFGNVEIFKEHFLQAAVTLFGSGWAWLVKDLDGKLSIMQGPNAWNPIVENLTPLLVCDVWEHAYYLDYQNRRLDYVESFWNLINWKQVEDRYRMNDHLMTDCC